MLISSCLKLWKKAMFIKILLTVLSCLVISTNSFAENTNNSSNKVSKDVSLYSFVGFNEKAKEIILIPCETITIDQSNNNLRYFWYLFVNKDKTVDFDTIKTYQSIDCTARKMHHLQSSFYLKGKHLRTFNLENTKNSIEYVLPDTYSDFAFHFVCNFEKLNPDNKDDMESILVLPKEQNAFLNDAQEMISRILKGYK